MCYLRAEGVCPFEKHVASRQCTCSISVFIIAFQMGTTKLERKCNETAAVIAPFSLYSVAKYTFLQNIGIQMSLLFPLACGVKERKFRKGRGPIRLVHHQLPGFCIVISCHLGSVFVVMV